MNKAKQLFELQEIDLGIEQKTENLTQVMSALGRDDDVVAAREALEGVNKKLGELLHRQRTEEWNINDIEAKIANEEKKLYEGSVKNPRELMSLQQEVDIIKGQRGSHEELLLGIMMETDVVQQDASLKKSELDTIEREWHENQERLSKQKLELESDLVALKQQREALVKLIDPISLKSYEGMCKVRQRVVVARVVQGSCQGCRISLPMSDQRRARMGHELVTCSNCGRILYLD